MSWTSANRVMRKGHASGGAEVEIGGYGGSVGGVGQEQEQGKLHLRIHIPHIRRRLSSSFLQINSTHSKSTAIMDTVKTVLSKLGLGEEAAAPAREPSTEQFDQLKEKYTKAGQEQVLSFYDALTVPEKAVSSS
jgi:hypothetical protein